MGRHLLRQCLIKMIMFITYSFDFWSNTSKTFILDIQLLFVLFVFINSNDLMIHKLSIPIGLFVEYFDF